MVDDFTNPTVATVYINDDFPAQDGYKIPSSLGLTFVVAPNAWSSSTSYVPGNYVSYNGQNYKCVIANTNSAPPNANWIIPDGVAWLDNPTTLTGGSWATVDTANRVIVDVEQSTSTKPPTDPSQLFQFIKHNGAYNTTGDFQNPGPIDTTQIPNVAAKTVIVSGVTLGSYTGQAGTTGIDVTLNVNYAGSLTEVSEYRIVAVPHGMATSSSWLWGSSGAWGSGAIQSSQIASNNNTVTIHVANMPLGIQLDLYFFVIALGGCSASWPTSNPIATTTAQSLSTNVMPKMPAGASFTATAVNIFAADSGMVRVSYNSGDSLINPILHANFTLNESTTPDTSQWAASANLYLRPYNAVLNQTDKTTYEAHNQGSLPGYFTNGKAVQLWAKPITAGQQYDVACSLLDGQGGETPLVYLGNYTVPKAQNGNPIGRVIGPGHIIGNTDTSLTNPITQDHIGDGSTYGRVKGTELIGNTVKQLNDGTNIRTAASVARALSATADAFGSGINPGQVHRLILEQSGRPGGTNLIYNPTFTAGLTGWGNFNSGVFSWSTDTFGGGRLNVDTGTQSTARDELKNQFITVFTGQNIVMSGILEPFTIIGAGSFAEVDVLDGSTVLGAFGFTTAGARQPFAFGPFQSTSGTLQVRCYVHVDGTAGSRVQASFYKLQLEYGSAGSAFVDHLATSNTNKTFDVNGDVYTTARMTKNGAVIPVVSTSGITYTSSTGASSTGNSTINLYWDGTNGSTIPTYHPPSSAVGVFTAVNSGNAVPYSATLNASSTYYFCFRINMATNGLEYRLQTGGSTTDKNDESWLNLDGYVPFAKNLACSTPAVNTSGGSGAPPGGGGGGQSCPSVEQIMETHRGFIPAGDVIAGDEVRDPDGSWNKVHFAQSVPAQIVEVGVAGETLLVDAAHAWMDPDGGWIDTLQLRLGTLLQGVDGKIYAIESLALRGEGVMRKLKVERSRFVLGRLVGHNATTL
jgi:hypothetical protein